MRHEKILAVDDDPINLAVMEELLCGEYDLTTASSGEEALAIAANLRPDLVLLDIVLPGIDGYETCRILKQGESLRYTKVMLVSAKGTLSERLKGYEVGADDYVTKPFDHAELSAKIRVFLRMKSMEELDDLKTEFLTLVAHETRTPLTRLVLLADILERGEPVPAEEREQVARMIRETTNHLHKLFDRGLHYCVLRAGRGGFRKSAFRMGDVLRDEIIAVTSARDDGDAGVLLDARDEPAMESDVEHVKLVTRLLLESALNRSRAQDGAPVQVELASDGDAVLLRVRSRAADLDPGSTRTMLEPFRTSSLNHHSSQGCLELPLAAETIRHLQGHITIDLDEDGNLVVQASFPRSVDSHVVEWNAGDAEKDRRAAA